jgi:hypothetical protein
VKTVMMFAPFLLLAACGKGDVNLKNASVEDVAKATQNAEKLSPGEWLNTTEIVSLDMPGMPAVQKEMMQAMSAAAIGKKTEVKNCITPEQAKKPDPSMFAGAGKNCQFERFSLSGGTMDAVLTCADPARGGGMNMAMKGQYGGDTYAMTSTLTMKGAVGDVHGATMVITSKKSGKRVGECSPAKEGEKL